MSKQKEWRRLNLSPLYEISPEGDVRSWRVERSKHKVAAYPVTLKTFISNNGKGVKSVRITFQGTKYTFSIAKLLKQIYGTPRT